MKDIQQREQYREQCHESNATFLKLQTDGKGNAMNSSKRGEI